MLAHDPTAQLQLTLTAPDVPDAERHRPTDLVLVLDRSGSMSGDKLLDLRAAALELVGQLRSVDRLAIVSFASDVRIDRPLAPPSEAVRRSIEGLSAGGGTAMGDGLQAALRLWTDPAPGRVRRTVLISDGMPDSVGVLDARATDLARAESPLTTVGIGEGYNESLMQRLADLGTGNFHWVQRGPQLATILGDELRTAQATVASAITLDLDSALGARIVAASGYPVRDGRLHLGSMFAGQQRTLWVTVALPDGLGPALHQPGAFDLRYVARDEPVAITASLPPLEVTRDAQRFYAGIDAEAWGDGVIEEQYNEMRADVAALVQQGRFADAHSAIEAYTAHNTSLNNEIQSQEVWDNLVAVEQLEAQLEVQAANPRHEQNTWSKGLSNGSFFGRRRGQYINPEVYNP